ncbi:hypothetical protein [Actinomadura sp. B10D3]|uniref:hypothetical protein n=1 Tax=Actinomadura sp. B10D3 TaxID=3153557 RepID=UPI00325D6E80
MSGYEIRGIAGHRGIRPSGPPAACLAAVGVLLVQQSAIRWWLDIPGLGLFEDTNDGVIATTLPVVLGALLVATAVAGHLAVSAEDRDTGTLGDASQQALLVIALVCVTVLPLLAGRPLFGAPHSASLPLLVLAAEIAVGTGFGVAYATLRVPAFKAILAACLIASLVSLLGRGILTQLLFSDAPVMAVPAEFDGVELKVEELRAWTPRVHALAIALAVVMSVPFLSRVRDRTKALVAVAAAPLVFTALTLLLGVVGSGTAAANAYGTSWWLYCPAGAAVGYVVALPLTRLLKRH